MENKKLIERKHFLIRAIEHNNVDPIEAQKEIDAIDAQVSISIRKYLNEQAEKLTESLKEERIVKKSDGDFKRGIASILISYLESEGFDNSEIKGFMRQGYRICRYR